VSFAGLSEKPMSKTSFIPLRSRSHCSASVATVAFSCLAVLCLLAGRAATAARPAQTAESTSSHRLQPRPAKDEHCCCPDCRPDLRPDDGIWLINTRGLGCSCSVSSDGPDLRVHSYHADQGWLPSTLDAFVAGGDERVITFVHVHGNRIDADTAVRRGWVVYHEMVRRTPDTVPLRFVIWSWPSSKIRGQLRDVRAKAARAEVESYYLAHVLSRIDPQVRVSLMGHSFGASIISGAAHLVGGGELAGLSLSPDRCNTGLQMRAVLVAAAMHNDWLLPGHYHERAVSQIDRTLLLYNSCDPYLKRYHLMWRRGRPKALGYAGLACIEHLGEAGERVRQMDVGAYIGRAHGWMDYLCAPQLVDTAARYVLWQSLDKPSPVCSVR